MNISLFSYFRRVDPNHNQVATDFSHLGFAVESKAEVERVPSKLSTLQNNLASVEYVDKVNGLKDR